MVQHGSYITAYKNIAEVYVEKENIYLQKIGKVFNPKDGAKSTLQLASLITQSYRSLHLDCKIKWQLKHNKKVKK